MWAGPTLLQHLLIFMVNCIASALTCNFFINFSYLLGYHLPSK